MFKIFQHYSARKKLKYLKMWESCQTKMEVLKVLNDHKLYFDVAQFYKVNDRLYITLTQKTDVLVKTIPMLGYCQNRSVWFQYPDSHLEDVLEILNSHEFDFESIPNLKLLKDDEQFVNFDFKTLKKIFKH